MIFRKTFSVLLVLVLVFSLPIVALAVEDETNATEQAEDVTTFVVADPDFSGLVSFTVSSSLGEITLQLPDGLDNSVLQFQNGYLYNVSGSTIYLYCKEYPSYTFSAARFSPVSYRIGSGYDTQQLSVSEVLTYSVSPDQMWSYLLYFLLILIVFVLFWRRSK